MTIQDIKHSLKHIPDIKIVWFKDGCFHRTEIKDGQEIDLTKDPLEEVKITKTKKEK